MAGIDEDMTRDEIRAALLARIEAAWPKYKDNPELARQIGLASNGELRKHLAWAEVFAEGGIELPQRDDEGSDDGETLSPRYSDDDRALFGRVLTTMWNPSGGYTLAKDECGDSYAGPAWVPLNLHSCSEYVGGGPLIQESARTLISAAGAEKLWTDILSKYGRGHCSGTGLAARRNNHADTIAATLPIACADAQANWKSIPRLTPKEFKEQREELARRAKQLAVELERFYLPRDPDECEFPGLLDFAELMSQEEADKFDQAVRISAFRIANRARKRAGVVGMDWDEYNSIGNDAKALGYSDDDLHTLAREDAFDIYALMQRDHTRPDWPYGGVPTLPDMLRRIAGKFTDDGDFPPIKSPNLGTAERSFFARALCKYFWTSFGDVSPSIVRDIVSMFYEGGVTEGNVSQIIAKVKEAYPLPEEP